MWDISWQLENNPNTIHSKKGAKCIPSTYHPISIHTVLSKVMKKIINHSIHKYLERYTFFNDKQYDFRQKRSSCLRLLICSTFTNYGTQLLWRNSHLIVSDTNFALELEAFYLTGLLLSCTVLLKSVPYSQLRRRALYHRTLNNLTRPQFSHNFHHHHQFCFFLKLVVLPKKIKRNGCLIHINIFP